MEERLTGGNTTDVVRLGDTVRRTTGTCTPAVHDLLHHLERVGFEGSPRVLGIDDHGREMLAYVEGEVGTRSPESPLPEWFRSEDACWGIGRWIREFQRAQSGFAPDPTKPWRRAAGESLEPGQVIVHHDVSPYNTVRRPDGVLVALDWDFARPGNQLEDLAWAAWRWVPLMTGSWWHTEYGVDHLTDEQLIEHQTRNLRALLDGYGASPDQRRHLAGEITAQLESHAADLKDMAATDPAFAALIERDYARAARDDARWWRTESTGHVPRMIGGRVGRGSRRSRARYQRAPRIWSGRVPHDSWV